MLNAFSSSDGGSPSSRRYELYEWLLDELLYDEPLDDELDELDDPLEWRSGMI
jgi:hypothetical protein